MRGMARSASSRSADGTKLIILPRRMVEGLKEAAERAGVPLTRFASEALEEAVRAEGMGVPLGEAVELYRMMRVQRDAGIIQVSRSIMEHLVSKLYGEIGEELERLWFEEGRWYGEYLKAKLKDERILEFLERVLEAAWNLDEAEIGSEEGLVRVRCVSFNMSLEATELMISYISGLMSTLGYEEVGRDSLRGLATLEYRRIPTIRQPGRN